MLVHLGVRARRDLATEMAHAWSGATRTRPIYTHPGGPVNSLALPSRIFSQSSPLAIFRPRRGAICGGARRGRDADTGRAAGPRGRRRYFVIKVLQNGPGVRHRTPAG